MLQAEEQLSLEARVVWKDFLSLFIPTMQEFRGRRLHLLPHDAHRKVSRLVLYAMQGVELLFKNDLEMAGAWIDEAKTIYMETSGELNLIETRRMPQAPSLSPTRRCQLVSNSRCRKRHRGRNSDRTRKQ